MSRYVIEIKPEYEDKIRGVMILGAENSNLYLDSMAVDELEELNSDYINEHFSDLQDTAYQRGLTFGKVQGQNETWDCAKRISLHPDNGGMTCDEISAAFGEASATNVLYKCSAQQAIEKLKAYEKKQSDKIKVGDEVEVLDSGRKYLIAWISGTVLFGFSYDGISCRLRPSDVRKTGRHFDIEAILREMANEDN